MLEKGITIGEIQKEKRRMSEVEINKPNIIKLNKNNLKKLPGIKTILGMEVLIDERLNEDEFILSFEDKPELKSVIDRTKEDHLKIIREKYNGSVRNYLLSFGEFKEDEKLEVGDIVRANEKCKERYIGDEGEVIEIKDNENIFVRFSNIRNRIFKDGVLFERDCLDFIKRKEEKTLSDKRKDILKDRTGQEWSGFYLDEDDLKSCFKEIKKEIPKECSFLPDHGKCGVVNVHDIINKHLGPKLC